MFRSTLLAVAALVALTANASASEAIHTFEMPKEMQVVRFLNLDGEDGGYPLMQLDEFCKLPVNQANLGNDCNLDSWIRKGDKVSFQT